MRRHAPTEKPTIDNLSEWQTFLRSHYNVRSQDAVLIIPLVGDSQKVEEQCVRKDAPLAPSGPELRGTKRYVGLVAHPRPPRIAYALVIEHP